MKFPLARKRAGRKCAAGLGYYSPAPKIRINPVHRSARSIVFLCILCAGIAGAVLDLWRPIDLKLLDLQFNLLRTWAPRPLARDVVVVGIDEATASALPEPLTLWHKHLGKFLHIMAQAKPAAVGIDIILPDRSYDAVAPGSDSALLRGILEARRTYPLVLALTVDPSGKPRHIHRAFLAVAGDGATGFALFPVDADGVVRRFDEHLAETAEPVPTLAGQIARRLGIEPRAGFIDYSRGETFGYIPLYKILVLADAGQQDVLDGAFRDKVVMLGTVLPLADRQRLPVQLASWDHDAYDTPGVLLQAQTVRNLLDGNLIQPVSRTLAAALTVAMTLLWFVAGSTATVAARAGRGHGDIAGGRDRARHAGLVPAGHGPDDDRDSGAGGRHLLRNGAQAARAAPAAERVFRLRQPGRDAGNPRRQAAAGTRRRKQARVRDVFRHPRLHDAQREHVARGHRRLSQSLFRGHRHLDP